VLAQAGHQVTIGTPNQSPRRSTALDIRPFSGGAMEELVRAHDITIAFGYLLREYPVIRKLAPYLVMDIIGPFILESLHMYHELGIGDRLAIHQRAVDVMLEQLEQADFMICGSERQRDYWLGALTMANRINPYTSDADVTLRSLIDVVPFGVPSTPPRPTRSAIKGMVPGIEATDVVVLWSGGIWNWFDPLTAIEAVAALRDEAPALKLYFMGVEHPNPKNPRMAMARRARERAGELAVLNRSVFFSDGWVPYEQRMDYLCDADIAISLHHEHAETRLAFRTRFLDYLWANLPIVATAGDTLSDTAVAAGAGVAVPDGDIAVVAATLKQLALEPNRRREMRERARTLAADCTWERVARPLLTYCANPHRAADAGRDDVRFPRLEGPGAFDLALAAYRHQGLPGVTRRGARILKRRAGTVQARLRGGMRLLRRSIEVWRAAGFRGVAQKASARLRRPTRT
jgi:glycosyltransferase involved in cell wall biosynthesis